jgi:hypothetical protein
MAAIAAAISRTFVSLAAVPDAALVQRTGDARIAAEAGLSERGRGGADASNQGRGDNESLQERGHGESSKNLTQHLIDEAATTIGSAFMPRITGLERPLFQNFHASK